ncbi:MAG: hypothetical protein HC915_11620 [Anaerolineae bacterium]|nr:hypothetical protein [Anaerolineae bacterium]
MRWFHAEDHAHEHEHDHEHAHGDETEAEAEAAPGDEDATDEPHGHWHDVFNEEDFVVVVRGEADAQRDLFPTFSEHLVGLSVDETREFSITLPEDFENEDLAGRTLEVMVRGKQMNSRTLPTLNDTFAQRVLNNEEKSLLDLRMEVRAEMEKTATNVAEQQLFEAVIEDLVNGAEMRYPDVLVELYIDGLLRGMERLVQQQFGIESLQRYLELTGQDANMLRERQRETAAER